MSDALARVKADLGRDAVILHTRTITQGGVLGMGRRSLVEITATTDARLTGDVASPARGAATARSTSPAPRAESRPASNATPANAAHAGRFEALVDDDAAISLTGPAREPRTPRNAGPARVLGGAGTFAAGASAGDTAQAPGSGRLAGDAPAADVTQPPVPAALSRESESALRREIEDIRAMVGELLRENRRERTPEVPAEMIDYYTELIGREVADELAATLVEHARARLEESGKAGPMRRLTGAAAAARERRIRQTLLDCLAEMVPPAAPLTLDSVDGPTVVALVGPTGVGKTTTIAKLAANMKIRASKRVGLITVDTYRIAAVEQLKTYAQILDVPLLSVQTPEEMQAAVGRLSDRDLILIDTAGRSQKDSDRLNELATFMQAANPDQIHLVLSTTAGEATLREAVDKFRALGATRLIFTKIDEAVGFGVILNVLDSVDLKLSYLTNGQSVPDDIEVGTARRVARLILQAGPEPHAGTRESIAPGVGG